MENKTYFFQPEKKILKQGFFMQDENNNIIYEAKMLKQPLLGAMVFEFINHKTNLNEEHKVGHTITSEQSGLFEMFSVKSSFKYDGKNIWDYLHEKGIRIKSSISNKGIGMIYEITFEGKEMAIIESASANGGKIITNPYFYNVTTSEEYLDLAFLTTFAIARTDQTFYN